MENSVAEKETLHVYRRELDPNGQDSLALVAARIGKGATVLDVGTGNGALGRFLGRDPSAVVDGVNYSHEENEIARPAYRNLVQADLEASSLAQLFEGQKYDVIVLADVLEHLRNPQRTLREAVSLLKPEGKLLISLPNVSYMGVVAGLIAGEFKYSDEGLLDRTHLRFFTRVSMLELLASAGLTAVDVQTVIQPLAKSEFAERRPDALTPAVQRALLSNPDALTYQFVVEARVSDERTSGVFKAALPRPELTFVAQVYWADKDEPYHESRSRHAVGKIGGERQTLRFDLPEGASLSSLRLDPSDRPGLLTMHTLALYDQAGQVRWRAEDDARLKPIGNTFTARSPESGGLLITMLDDDPGLEWQVPRLVAAQGDYVSWEVDWPSSPDALFMKEEFARFLRDREAKLTATCAALSGQLAARAAELTQTQGGSDELRALHASELRLLNGLIVRMDAVMRLHATQLAALENDRARQRSEEKLLRNDVSSLRQEVARLQGELSVLAKGYADIHGVLQKHGLAHAVRRDLVRFGKAGKKRLSKLWSD